mmetsp:Transcript_26688/g.56192  ORF Transcript_26688/g.56192 Transcript_26688/m.56192 type:complete len:228 (-) Transcript_26688:1872-2555(-)
MVLWWRLLSQERFTWLRVILRYLAILQLTTAAVSTVPTPMMAKMESRTKRSEDAPTQLSYSNECPSELRSNLKRKTACIWTDSSEVFTRRLPAMSSPPDRHPVSAVCIQIHATRKLRRVSTSPMVWRTLWRKRRWTVTEDFGGVPIPREFCSRKWTNRWFRLIVSCTKAVRHRRMVCLRGASDLEEVAAIHQIRPRRRDMITRMNWCTKTIDIHSQAKKIHLSSWDT